MGNQNAEVPGTFAGQWSQLPSGKTSRPPRHPGSKRQTSRSLCPVSPLPYGFPKARRTGASEAADAVRWQPNRLRPKPVPGIPLDPHSRLALRFSQSFPVNSTPNQH